MLHFMLQIWLPVSILWIKELLATFQNFNVLSVVPPPEASMFDWCGDHDNAFTAATWSLKHDRGEDGIFREVTSTLLSLPPDANKFSEGDHLIPQTSYRWPVNYMIEERGVLISHKNMLPSRDPLVIIDPFQSKVPTLCSWLSNNLNYFYFSTSNIFTAPRSSPIASISLLAHHDNDDTIVGEITSINLLASFVIAFHV